MDPAIQEARIDPSVEEILVSKDPLVEGNGCLDTLDDGHIQRSLHSANGLQAVSAVADDLGCAPAAPGGFMPCTPGSAARRPVLAERSSSRVRGSEGELEGRDRKSVV